MDPPVKEMGKIKGVPTPTTPCILLGFSISLLFIVMLDGKAKK
jgi:hypothetical protein